MIRFSCPGCSAVYAVDVAKGGRTGQCPGCGARFTIPAGGPDEPPPPDLTPVPVDPAAPVEVEPCPGCGVRLSVEPGDLGVNVECPYCKTVFTASRAGGPAPASRRTPPDEDRPSRQEPDRPRRSRRWDNESDEEDEDYEDDRPVRRSRRRPGQKPGNVTAIAAMLLAGGIYALIWDLGMIGGSTGFCCLWPGLYFTIVWGICAIVRGSTMLGQSELSGPPRTLLILQIITIVNFDVVNCILGIVGLILLNNPEVQDYYDEVDARSDD
jgi:hypothetical protein